MLFQSILIACILVAVQSISVEDSFKEHSVVPDVVPKAPKEWLKVVYENELVAKDGVVLTPTQVQNKPNVEWEAKSDEYYALIMTDPDAPSRTEPKVREYKHWVVVNIPGNDVDKGEELAEFIGSGPPKDTGLHRYVFLLYKQPRKLQFEGARVSSKSRRNRPKFHAARFAEHHQFGELVAGTFYQAKYDDYVPKLHQQLSED